MKKKELVEKLALLTKQNLGKAEMNLNAIVTLFDSVLTVGDGRILLPNVGILERVVTKQRMGINPRTGEPIVIESKNKIRFKPSKVIKRKVNE